MRNAPINDLPHAGKGGDRLGIYLIVEVNDPTPGANLLGESPHI